MIDSMTSSLQKPLLVVNNLGLQVKQKVLLRDLSFTVQPGQCIALLGANGAGKSSLLKTLLGVHAATSGSINLEGQVLSCLNAAARARYLAYLPQARELAWPMTIESVIRLGISQSYGSDMRAHQEAIEHLVRDCELGHLQGRSTHTLSGGELARVHVARLFASKAPLLLADEPIAELDPLHQYRVLELIKQYVQQGNSAIVALHDIALAAQFADHIIVLKHGAIVTQGGADILTSECLADVYGINAKIELVDGHKVLINRGKC